MARTVKKKSFWQRPEGVTGAIVLSGVVLGLGYLAYSFLGFILSNTIALAGILLVLAVIIFSILDPKMRNLIWYMYKSVMRWITSLFIQIDPIGILKSYVEDLRDNLKKMNRQINQLRKQMHVLNEQIQNNKRAIQSNLELASKAKEKDKRDQMILKSRKAGRLKESNVRLEDLYKKMKILYRVLNKMYENSNILMEDINDQVEVKEQERKAIHASHGAMKSAMNIIKGNQDKRQMFDMALEAVADDVSQKVGEMERFMDMSSNFMESIDLQNGVFEEEGLKMLEKWEQEGVSLILGSEKTEIIELSEKEGDVLDLNVPVKKAVRESGHQNQYDSFFD